MFKEEGTNVIANFVLIVLTSFAVIFLTFIGTAIVAFLYRGPSNLSLEQSWALLRSMFILFSFISSTLISYLLNPKNLIWALIEGVVW